MAFDKVLYKARVKALYTEVNANTDPDKPNDEVIDFVAQKLADALEEYFDGNITTTVGNDITDNPEDIAGTLGTTNTIFQLRYNFVNNSCKVYLNGQRLIKGATKTFTEIPPNKFQLNFFPEATDQLCVDYKRSA
jgi:hypothetical protein